MTPYLRLMRPQQWVKNGFVLIPLLFSLRYAEAMAWLASLSAMASFIAASSAVYVVNDIHDREADKHHPLKCSRPLASGEITAGSAWVLAVVLLAASLLLAFALPHSALAVLLIYIGVNMAYSRWLKHVAIVDVLCIAVGFVLRVLMGCYAISVMISPWIVIATFMLALFMGFGKRRHELQMAEGGTRTRVSLGAYSIPLLDAYITIACCASLISYALYAVEIAQHQRTSNFTYTVLFVAFGLFRYLHAIYFKTEGGEPERILFSDRLFLLNLVLWLAAAFCLLHV